MCHNELCFKFSSNRFKNVNPPTFLTENGKLKFTTVCFAVAFVNAIKFTIFRTYLARWVT